MCIRSCPQCMQRCTTCCFSTPLPSLTSQTVPPFIRHCLQWCSPAQWNIFLKVYKRPQLFSFIHASLFTTTHTVKIFSLLLSSTFTVHGQQLIHSSLCTTMFAIIVVQAIYLEVDGSYSYYFLYQSIGYRPTDCKNLPSMLPIHSQIHFFDFLGQNITSEGSISISMPVTYEYLLEKTASVRRW